MEIDRWRRLVNRNEIRVPGSTTATNVVVVVVLLRELLSEYRDTRLFAVRLVQVNFT